MPAKAQPCRIVNGRNQSSASFAGKPRNATRPAKAPEKEMMKNTGITSEGMNVEGSRGMSLRLRAVMPHAMRMADAFISGPLCEPGSQRQAGQNESQQEHRCRDRNTLQELAGAPPEDDQMA